MSFLLVLMLKLFLNFSSASFHCKTRSNGCTVVGADEPLFQGSRLARLKRHSALLRVVFGSGNRLDGYLNPYARSGAKEMKRSDRLQQTKYASIRFILDCIIYEHTTVVTSQRTVFLDLRQERPRYWPNLVAGRGEHSPMCPGVRLYQTLY
jgi:hypothetical protein